MTRTDEFERGTQIVYVPHHAQGNEKHPDVETGFVTSASKGLVFCRFWNKSAPDELQTKANSEAVLPYSLVVKDTRPQAQVEAAFEQWCC